MLRSTRRLLVLVLAIPLVVLLTALIYGVMMSQLEGTPRGFWSNLGWAAETLTTTGYGADAKWSHPVTVLFVIVVQFLGVFLVFLVVPIYLIPFLEERFEARVPREAPAKLSGHVIIYRYGPAVEMLLAELSGSAVPTLIVEEDETIARRLQAEGHAVIFRTFDDAGAVAARLLHARALIANGNDAEDAAAVLMARELGFVGPVLAVVEDPLHAQPMRLAGASSVVTPRHVLASALAGRASDQLSPNLGGAQDLGELFSVQQIRIDPKSPLAGRTLVEVGIGAQTGAVIIGQWVAGHLVTQPDAQMQIHPRGILVAVGTSDSLEQLARLAGPRSMPLRDVGSEFVVAGYGEVGRMVVQQLRDAGESVRVIDRLAQDGVDLVGSAHHPGILAKAGVERARAVILALDNDAATMFATVIVRDLSADVPIIARVNQVDNVQRIHQAGADMALSVSQIAGQILARDLLGEEAVSIAPKLRLLKSPVGSLAGKRAREANIREQTGCSVVMVERAGQAMSQFDADFTFVAADNLYIAGSDAAVRRFQELVES